MYSVPSSARAQETELSSLATSSAAGASGVGSRVDVACTEVRFGKRHMAVSGLSTSSAAWGGRAAGKGMTVGQSRAAAEVR